MKELKILRTDTGCVFKFFEDDRKLRIDLEDGLYYLMATKQNSRYFHFVKRFKTLEEAKKFIYTSEAWDRTPENLHYKKNKMKKIK